MYAVHSRIEGQELFNRLGELHKTFLVLPWGKQVLFYSCCFMLFLKVLFSVPKATKLMPRGAFVYLSSFLSYIQVTTFRILVLIEDLQFWKCV